MCSARRVRRAAGTLLRRAGILASGLVVLVVACRARADDYPLDAVPRAVAQVTHACPDVPLDLYRGDVLPLNQPVKVHVAFVPKLRRLEEIIRATAIEVYGRAPVRLVHAGGYSCRELRPGRRWLSEHSLGNAIDVLGVDFAPAAGLEGLPELRGAFRVRVKQDWLPGPSAAAAVHSRFLRLLARRIIADRTFRVILGPAHRDHRDHFHLDMAPYRLVDVFGSVP
jgi:hypothetical protein